MIKYLKYAFTFSNGRVIKQDIQLQQGSTLITGANGQGKSLNFEVISYLLFGNKALRGVGTDYKKITAEMAVDINGETYVISRTKTQAEVLYQGEKCASGVSAVNPFLTRTLGYGYDVFRVAHWCAQGDIQALASMRPTERKQMIDSVAGLTSMDGLTKIIGDQIREGKAAIDYLTTSIVHPVAPAKPFTTKAAAAKALKAADELQDKYVALIAVHPVNIPVEPVAPLAADFPEAPKPFELAELKTKLPELSGGLPSSTTQLKLIIGSLDVEKAKAERLKTKLAALGGRQETIKLLPKAYPTVKPLRAAWDAYSRYLKIKELQSQSEVECPQCAHTFHLSDEAEKLIAEDAGSSVKPEIAVGEYRRLEDLLADRVEFDSLTQELQSIDYEAVVEMLEKANDGIRQLKAYDDEANTYKAKRKNLDDMFNTQSAGHLINIQRIKKHYDAQMVQHNKLLAVYNADMATVAERSAKYESAVKEMDKLDQKFGDVNLHLTEVRSNMVPVVSAWATYDADKVRYDSDMKTHLENAATLKGLTAKNAQLELARKAVKEVKTRVQSHLIPSLNQVASDLMNEMTGGEYSSVIVGENFEVEVDGQPLRTLSGSGKDLANLTLRIALGRIITHRVMGFMLLDEIDSAMDDTRAKYTWDCIERITPQIGQVIQASHKDLVSDNTITV
jgi:exonuclease SbcC